MDLFEDKAKAPDPAREPLASRMRPRNLDEVVGQDRILGEGRLLRRAIEADRLSSIILYGPPGCGKTSIAEVIARVTSRHFERTSGVTANVTSSRRSVQATVSCTTASTGFAPRRPSTTRQTSSSSGARQSRNRAAFEAALVRISQDPQAEWGLVADLFEETQP